MDVEVAQAFAAGLEAFFNDDAGAGEVRARYFDQLYQAVKRAAVGKKIVDKQHGVAGFKIRTRNGNGIVYAVRVGRDRRAELVAVLVVPPEFARENDRHFEILGGNTGNANAGRLNRENARYQRI